MQSSCLHIIYLKNPLANGVPRVVVRITWGRKDASVVLSGIHNATTLICKNKVKSMIDKPYF